MLEVLPLNQIADVGAPRSKDPTLISREIIFEEFQPMWSRYLNVTLRQTDRQTIYDSNTALCIKVHRTVKSKPLICLITSKWKSSIICNFSKSNNIPGKQLLKWIRGRSKKLLGAGHTEQELITQSVDRAPSGVQRQSPWWESGGKAKSLLTIFIQRRDQKLRIKW